MTSLNVWRRCLQAILALLMISTIAACQGSKLDREAEQASKEQGAREAGFQLPEPPATLQRGCADPGITDDPQKDAISHRISLASCARKVRRWQAFWSDFLVLWAKHQEENTEEEKN